MGILMKMIDRVQGKAASLTARYSLVLSLLAVLTGCITAAPPAPIIDDSSFYLGRFDKVWDVTLKVLEKKSLAVKEINKEKGEIITRFVNYSVGVHAHNDLENIAVKPDILLGLYTQVGYTLAIKLTPINDMSTQVKITATIEAYDTNVTQKWQKCPSKGIIERELLDKIKAFM
jgi:hypothetical protein